MLPKTTAIMIVKPARSAAVSLTVFDLIGNRRIGRTFRRVLGLEHLVEQRIVRLNDTFSGVGMHLAERIGFGGPGRFCEDVEAVYRRG